jgi:spore germination protein YaaH
MDGVNLDFEGGDGADRAGFTAFVTRLAQSLHAAGAHRQVTLDTSPAPRSTAPGWSTWPPSPRRSTASS